MKNPFKGVNGMKGVNDEISDNQPEEVIEESTDDNTEDIKINDKSNEIDKNTEDLDNNKEEEFKKNEWQEKYEKLNDQYIRLAADFDNFRKRQAQERESLLKYGAESTVTKLLEVMDNFERGLKAIETVEDCDKVKECYNLAYKNFYDVMSKIGLEAIKAIGEEFDPNLHEAVMQTPTSEHAEHTIIAELQKGYKLGDKVLRPTLVNVATQAE